ncbi:MAG: HlyD family secretion protein, partial [Hydrogenobacter sp.]
MKKLFFPLFVLLAIVPLLVFLNRSNKVKIFVVEERPIKKVVYASGYVKPVNYVVVKSEVSGYIQEIRVKEGDKVKKGQILAVIDPGPLLASLKEVEERLKLVRERLREDSDYRKSLQEQVDITKRNMEQAQRYLERRKSLSERGLIPREQYEEAKRSYENAKSEYQRALASYEDAITSLKSEEKTLYASIERIKREMERYYIRSPIDGVVLNKYVEIGDYVNYMSD